MQRKHILKATVYDKKGNILSTATNNYTKTHPQQAFFAQLVGQPARVYLHAELLALLRVPRGSLPYKLSVERYKKDGTEGNAEPCEICKAAMRHYGVTKVEYTL